MPAILVPPLPMEGNKCGPLSSLNSGAMLGASWTWGLHTGEPIPAVQPSQRLPASYCCLHPQEEKTWGHVSSPPSGAVLRASWGLVPAHGGTSPAEQHTQGLSCPGTSPASTQGRGEPSEYLNWLYPLEGNLRPIPNRKEETPPVPTRRMDGKKKL